MPVKKKTTTRRSSKKEPASTKHDCCYDRGCGISGTYERAAHQPVNFAKKMILTLLGILLAYMIVWMGTLIRNNLEAFHYIGDADRQERTITVDGFAEVSVTPDVGQTTMGVTTEGETVADAQAENSSVMNTLIARLQEVGVEEADIQTQNYNVFPQYDYTAEEGRELVGYQVSQNVLVRIRDVENASTIIALAGEVGANQVSGLTFDIDDPEVYEQEAREEAVADAFQKAHRMARLLGVELVRVVSYGEFDDSYSSYYRESFALDAGVGFGGGAPAIEPGTSDVSMNVSVTFEIR